MCKCTRTSEDSIIVPHPRYGVRPGVGIVYRGIRPEYIPLCGGNCSRREERVKERKKKCQSKS